MARTSEAWETAQGGPCGVIERPRGRVARWVLGEQRYRVKAPSGERVVEGLQQAREVAHELAGS